MQATTLRTPSPPRLQQWLLRAGLGALTAVAAVAIVLLAIGGEVGDVEGYVLLTTLIVGLQALVSVCYLLAAQQGFGPLAALGGLASLSASLIGLSFVWLSDLWDNGRGDSVVQLFFCLLTIAFTVAQLCLLLNPRARGSRPMNEPVTLATCLAAAGVAAMICVYVFTDYVDDGWWRLSASS